NTRISSKPVRRRESTGSGAAFGPKRPCGEVGAGMATHTLDPGAFNPWMDRRSVISDRRKGEAESPVGAVLNEPIPGGASLAYVLGSGLLYLFLSQIDRKSVV